MESRKPLASKDRTQATIEDLPSERRDIFLVALENVLSTELAQVTYAQILDGAPIADVAIDHYSPQTIHPDHPIRSHTTLCEGVRERIRSFRSSLDLTVLLFPSQLIHSYTSAGIRSTLFDLRLVEMIAVSLHQIAIFLFRLDESLHKKEPYESWKIQLASMGDFPLKTIGPLPTLFFVPYYEQYEQYPEGIADMIGYWAENRILGGVVLFYKGQDDSKLNHLIFFNSDRKGVTRRIYALSNEQKESLITFLLSRNPTFCPFPILGDQSNRIRVDPEDATERHCVFRDTWERRPLDPDWYWKNRMPRSSLDYPEIDDDEIMDDTWLPAEPAGYGGYI